MKFKIGDRVRIIRKEKVNGPNIGAIGTVFFIDKVGRELVEFDSPFKDGHCAGGHDPEGKDGHCWYITSEYSIDLAIPNNKLSKLIYPEFIESKCKKYLVKEML